MLQTARILVDRAACGSGRSCRERNAKAGRGLGPQQRDPTPSGGHPSPHITSAGRTHLGSRASERGRETRCSGAALQFNSDCLSWQSRLRAGQEVSSSRACVRRGAGGVGRLDCHGSVAWTKLPVLWPGPTVTRRDQARGNTSSDGARLRPVRARPSPLPRPRAEPRRPAGLGPGLRIAMPYMGMTDSVFVNSVVPVLFRLPTNG